MPILTTAELDRASAHALLARVESLPASPARETWVAALTRGMEGRAGGTMRAWMEAHDGQDVHTLQATVTNERTHVGEVRSVWQPGARTVDASRAGGVQLDGSRRDYAGCRVVSASDDVLIVATTWGEDRQVMVYVTA